MCSHRFCMPTWQRCLWLFFCFPTGPPPPAYIHSLFKPMLWVLKQRPNRKWSNLYRRNPRKNQNQDQPRPTVMSIHRQPNRFPWRKDLIQQSWSHVISRGCTKFPMAGSNAKRTLSLITAIRCLKGWVRYIKVSLKCRLLILLFIVFVINLAVGCWSFMKRIKHLCISKIHTHYLMPSICVHCLYIFMQIAHRFSLQIKSSQMLIILIDPIRVTRIE